MRCRETWMLRNRICSERVEVIHRTAVALCDAYDVLFYTAREVLCV